ncbi:S8 family peptidase [Microlunatus flavus]|uniref:Subtilase family protein n=1 Tax=Microlunatus flavus TaxID=1036181 RepID=A0A1H9DDT0_9ACTN|nr:S8/S53 family peptidase [Microlunatus flavus]SEQ11655.1 Subtilase family protein [Microlunatus flavus]
MPHDPADPAGTAAASALAGPPLAPTPRRHGPRRDHLDPRGARFLDPGSALRFGGETLQPTAYAGDELLVRPGRDGRMAPEVHAALEQAAGSDHELEVEDVDARLAGLAGRAGLLDSDDHPLVLRVHLRRPHDDEEPRGAVDAWVVLQRFRRLLRGRPGAGAVSLMHLLTTGGLDPAPYVPWAITPKPHVAFGIGGNPHVAFGATPFPHVAFSAGADPFSPMPHVAFSQATAEYAQPGSGGRMPVTWMGPPPTRRADADLDGARRPVVAVLDTGTGRHPWLDAVVERAPRCGDLPIGLTDEATDVERLGVLSGALTGSLDIEAGHGTFIAGLVHQRCPDARILSVRVVQPDGVIDEYDLLLALSMLWVRQSLALQERRTEDLVDVVSLSLGYYHEQPTDADFDPVMRTALRALARLGVAVVTSAGNDATSRPAYPAAFAPWSPLPDEVPEEIPLVAVGATNPDGTVALFSNAGPWVRTWRPGAALVSTVPTSFDGGSAPSVELVAGGQVRATIDPDDFRSGFATWSGTSFAAPLLAGDVAQCLNASRRLRQDPDEQEDPLDVCWSSLRRAAPQA